MKLSIVTLLVLLIAAGCSSVSNVADVKAKSRGVKAFTIQDFNATDLATAKLFQDTIQGRLEKDGYYISDRPDFVVSGVITKTRGSWTTGGDWIDSAIITAKTKDGQLLTSIRFDQGSSAVMWWGSKSPADIANDLGKKLSKNLR